MYLRIGENYGVVSSFIRIHRCSEWIIIRNFNEIFDGEEHSSYKDSCITIVGMHEFDSVVQHCRLINLGYQGLNLLGIISVMTRLSARN